MPNPILQKELFPLECQEAGCGYTLDEKDYLEALNRYGMPYVDGGDTVFHGFTCPNCMKTSLFPLPKKNSILDLRNLIIIPDRFDTHYNCYEQRQEKCCTNDNPDYLKFHFVPAWEESEISFKQINSYFESLPPQAYSKFNEHVPYLRHDISIKEINDIVGEENEDGSIRFRRLYPHKEFYRNLFIALAPPRAIKINSEHQLFREPEASPLPFSTEAEGIEKERAWNALIQLCAGKTIKDEVLEKFSSVGFEDFDAGIIDSVIERHSWRDTYMSWKVAEHLDDVEREVFSTVGGVKEFWDWDGWKQVINELLPPICTEIALSKIRDKLTKWKDVKPGDALFVDAPLGVGKTLSIAKVLAEDPNLSAVVFMPTNQLCDEFEAVLKKELSAVYKGAPIRDNEIYRADGIREKKDNPKPDTFYCPHYKEIVDRYKQNWIKKSDICKRCVHEKNCPFRKHRTRAPLKRIVITTHQQYSNFYSNPSILKWFKDGYYQLDDNGRAKKDDKGKKLPVKDAPDRDFFIVDEDLVISQCYQPIALTMDDFGAFTGTVISFLQEHGVQQEIVDKIKDLVWRITVCQKTALVVPVDKEFSIPSELKSKWSKSYDDQIEYLLEVVERDDTTGNHLDIIEYAIRKGCTVMKYGRVPKMIYMPNPKTFDLANLPPHVFFDGTKLDDEFLQHKLKNVEIKTLDIDSPAIWTHKVVQNTNSDLPKSRIERDKDRVLQFLKDILEQYRQMATSVLIITKKAIREKYLDKFLEEQYPSPSGFMCGNTKIIVNHFGGLKGLNIAKDCTVAIMLGSYILSDAVEIALAQDFIDFPEYQEPFPPEDNMWTWDKSRNKREYNDEYADVGKIANAVRYSEHRQALGRTRYLFHGTDFYILSKDRIDEYEPFLKDVKTYNYREDLFPLRQLRNDDKYKEVKLVVADYLKQHETCRIVNIMGATGRTRVTVAKHMKKMVLEGFLEKVEKTEYRLAEEQNR